MRGEGVLTESAPSSTEDSEHLRIQNICRYHRMDGSTNVAVRARLVDDFNSNDDIFLFLLTTKVGGLGINLTGADRCRGRSIRCKLQAL